MPIPELPAVTPAAPKPDTARAPLPSLQGRLFVLVALALLPILILALFQIWDAHRLRSAAAHSKAVDAAASLAQQHAAALHAAGGILSALGATPEVASGLPDVCQPILAAVTASGETFVNLARAAPDGTLECSANPAITELPDAAAEVLRTAAATGALTVGTAHVPSFLGGQVVLPLAVPLDATDDAPQRLLVGGVRLNWFNALSPAPSSLPAGTVVILSDDGGRVIGAAPPLPAAVDTLPQAPDASARPAVWPGLFEGDGPRVVASSATRDGLHIVVAIAREASDSAVRLNLLAALAVSVAALLVALVAGHGIANVLVLDPLGPLRAATARLAQGDFTGRIGPPYRGPAEMVDLAQALDAMADRIADRELELINSETKLLVKRQSEERYRTLVERAPEAIVVVSAQAVVFANNQAARVFGASTVDGLIGTPLDHLLDPGETLAALLNALPSASEPPRLHEVHLRRLGRGAFWAEVAFAPVDYAGHPAWHVVVRDITGRKEVERQLAQASKLATLGEVAAGLAHELSQPMNVIRVAAEAAALEGHVTLPPSTREHLALIADQAGRMGEIIDHVRVFSRPEPGERAVFSAFMSARRALSFLEQQIRDDDIGLDAWFDGSRGEVDGVAVHVEQIILNLLTNARDGLRRHRSTGAPPDGWRPHITVTGRTLDCAGEPAGIILTVGDNAGALDADALDHAFDPFSPTNGGGLGSGLALSICYALATAMGGTLSVRNEGDGVDAGALFTLTLPPATAVKPDAQEAAVADMA